MLLSLNSATLRFLQWTGSPEESIYLANIFPVLSSVGRVLSDVRLFFFLFIGLRAKQYPLLLSGLVTLGTTIVLIVLESSVQGFIIEMDAFILFVLSMIAIYFTDNRTESTEMEVVS
jgi:hypothetical protein